MKPLMDFLKESIAARHARMETLPFVVALTSGELPLRCYVAQLRALAVIQATLDQELRHAGLPQVEELMRSRPSRLAHLRADLSAFDRLWIPDCLDSVRRAQQIAEWVRKVRLEQPGDLLGCVYVLEGTTFGNAVHLPDVVKAFGEQALGATHYYAGYRQQTKANWLAFSAVVNGLALDAGRRDTLLRVVHRFFDLLELLFSSLYPVAEEGWGFTAAALNPEAGNHAVPGDEALLRAAVAAARRCREEYPYFDERYGERGQKFAHSDAAWLVTLTALPRVERRGQVEWLGRVLGNRGMPRVTLERQLELLHEELSLAAPGETGRYEGLREAAEELKEERLRLVPEALFGEFERQFKAATDDERAGRLRGTGALLVSAVCDEAAGIAGAVTSLVEWLGDPGRFPPEWVEEVARTVERARHAVLRR